MLSVFATLNPFVAGTILVRCQPPISLSGRLEIVIKQSTGLLAVGIGGTQLAKSGLEIGSEFCTFSPLHPNPCCPLHQKLELQLNSENRNKRRYSVCSSSKRAFRVRSPLFMKSVRDLMTSGSCGSRY